PLCAGAPRVRVRPREMTNAITTRVGGRSYAQYMDEPHTGEVVSAVGHYDGFFEVVGVKRPGGGGCWCMSYRDTRLNNLERPLYMQDECSREPGPGVLAYVDGEPAGWCSIAPRSSYRRLMHSRTIQFLDERDAWAAVCFVVRPRFRGQGLMNALLEGAVEHA